MRLTCLIPSMAALTLAACNSQPSSTSGSPEASFVPPSPAAAPSADPFASHDPRPGMPPEPGVADDMPRPVMQAQVVLERLGFAPGVIDGKMGVSTRNALTGYQEAAGLPVTGELDEPTRQRLGQWSNIPATRLVKIPADFAAGPFQPLPREPADQARLAAMGYETLDEKLAERFHTTVEVLRQLNPAIAGPAPSPSAAPPATATASPALPPPATFAAGQQIRVPNIGGDTLDPSAVKDADWAATLRSLGIGNRQPHAGSIVVSKSKGTLRAYDEGGKLIALFTVTTGSGHDPLPLGKWKINGIDYNPKFSYDPSLFWDVPDSKGEHLLPPGPNGPVGVAWIDLSKEHYGIHGTPHPETIGRAESHGCVRLTNWDVARLAQMVDSKTRVLFEA